MLHGGYFDLVLGRNDNNNNNNEHFYVQFLDTRWNMEHTAHNIEQTQERELSFFLRIFAEIWTRTFKYGLQGLKEAQAC